MKKLKLLEESRNLLWWLALLAGGALLFMIILESISPCGIPSELSSTYLVILITFVGVKEIVRWSNGEYTPKLGEMLVIMWWTAFILIELTSYILNWLGIIPGGLTIPNELPLTCIEVVIVYGCSSASKIIFKAKQKNQNKNQGKSGLD